jgi:hypothetical protein
MTTSMDAVYEFAITPRKETGMEGVVVRFMPDTRQVENALEVRQCTTSYVLYIWSSSLSTQFHK